jgi:hypothetical protein
MTGANQGNERCFANANGMQMAWHLAILIA